MEQKTYEEILQILKDNLNSVDDFANEEYDPEELGLGPIKEVHSQGGWDRGSDWRRVILFEDHNVYIEVSGYYTSYDGTEFYDGWGCCKQVEPKEVTITVYS